MRWRIDHLIYIGGKGNKSWRWENIIHGSDALSRTTRFIYGMEEMPLSFNNLGLSLKVRKQELISKAKENGLKVTTLMTKRDLVEALMSI